MVSSFDIQVLNSLITPIFLQFFLASHAPFQAVQFWRTSAPFLCQNHPLVQDFQRQVRNGTESPVSILKSSLEIFQSVWIVRLMTHAPGAQRLRSEEHT